LHEFESNDNTLSSFLSTKQALRARATRSD
jgi:hypothetical protein